MIGFDLKKEDFIKSVECGRGARRRRRGEEEPERPYRFPQFQEFDKYKDKAIRFIDKHDHYELVFMDGFNTPSSGAGGFEPNYTLITDIVLDMKEADKTKEIHVFVGSYGGAVHALNLIFEQLLQFKYRVGINLGYACSCGWMLLFACQERYVSAYSTNMYHSMSSMMYGKLHENKASVDFEINWWNELLKLTDTEKVLTPEEFELGKTTEITLTGAELISRGAAKDYSEYVKRNILQPIKAYALSNNFLLIEDTSGVFHPFVAIRQDDKDIEVGYDRILRHINTEVNKDNAVDDMDLFILACGNGFAVNIDFDDDDDDKKKSKKKGSKKGDKKTEKKTDKKSDKKPGKKESKKSDINKKGESKDDKKASAKPKESGDKKGSGKKK